MRINKFLALCSVASRRKSEEMVLDGKVKVNGKLITNLATDVDPETDVVSVDNNVVTVASDLIYLAFNKPKGCVCTANDEFDRKTIFDYIPKLDCRVFSVGRLDYDTEGLLFLTNDGDLANRLTHPSGEVEKTYVANIEGLIAEKDLAMLAEGVILDDGYKTLPAKVKRLGIEKNVTRLELKIKEGKNRQVRRMFDAIGKNVLFLKRTEIGDIRLGGMARGETRALTEKEIKYLKRA